VSPKLLDAVKAANRKQAGLLVIESSSPSEEWTSPPSASRITHMSMFLNRWLVDSDRLLAGAGWTERR